MINQRTLRRSRRRPARNGATIEAVVHRAFAEVLALGCSLGVPYHYFEMDFEKETLHFSLSSEAYQPGEDLVIAISLVESCPFVRRISDLPEGTRELLLGLLDDTDAAE